jgi:hypothetical protein
MVERERWVRVHSELWVITWFAWAPASMSLVAFTWAWVGRLREAASNRAALIVGAFILTSGVVFDLFGERLNAAAAEASDFARVARLYDILSAGWANGLYCAGGLILSVVAWRVGDLRGWAGVMGFLMWGIGLAMSAAVVVDNGPVMIVSGAAVMALFIPWCAWVGWRMRDISE